MRNEDKTISNCIVNLINLHIYRKVFGWMIGDDDHLRQQNVDKIVY